eukprot:gene25705-31041_t
MEDLKTKKDFITPIKRKKASAPTAQPSGPLRKSPRLQQLEIDQVLKESEPESPVEEGPYQIDYSDMPVESDQLDDEEFQVYAELRKWRLLTCRSLETEPYKICQNRTLAELIRRRRNDAQWASLSKGDEHVIQDLLECWGLGPAKVVKGGYGYQLAEVLERDELKELLAQSRLRGEKPEDGKAVEEQEDGDGAAQ